MFVHMQSIPLTRINSTSPEYFRCKRATSSRRQILNKGCELNHSACATSLPPGPKPSTRAHNIVNLPARSFFFLNRGFIPSSACAPGFLATNSTCTERGTGILNLGAACCAHYCFYPFLRDRPLFVVASSSQRYTIAHPACPSLPQVQRSDILFYFRARQHRVLPRDGGFGPYCRAI